MLKKALTDTLPVMTGYLVLGFGFGIIMKTDGFGVLLTLAMSLFIYAGSVQYVAVGMLAGGAPLLVVGITTLVMNARHLFYGISMIDKYKNMGKCKPYLIFALTDETYSLVCNDDATIQKKDRKGYYLWVSLFNHMYWITGSLLGAVIGSVVKFNSEGIDFALTALFLTVFLEQWLSTKKHIPAIIGTGASLLCLLIFGRDNFLIPTMLVIAVSLCLYKEGVRHE
ncbi:MAG: AzlC family ABC transporter permease [Lachnospiraceae bacterium]|nr:AzlC family ABC transporter permease [Lachnospiraceae bacterium]